MRRAGRSAEALSGRAPRRGLSSPSPDSSSRPSCLALGRASPARGAGDRGLLQLVCGVSRQELQPHPVGRVRRSRRRPLRQAAPARRAPEGDRALPRRHGGGARPRGRRRRRSTGTIGGTAVDREVHRSAAGARRLVEAAAQADERADVRPADARDRGRDPRRTPRRHGDQPPRPAAGDGRGARRHPARPDPARRRLAGGEGATSSRRTSSRSSRARPRSGSPSISSSSGWSSTRARCAAGSARPRSSRTRASPSRWGSASSSRCRSTSCSSPDVRYLPFALFMGVAMSITAFPVLARILIERRMLKRPVGALALASAAIDDVTAWGLLALATAVAGARHGAARDPGDRCWPRVHGRACSSSAGGSSAASRRPTTRSGQVPTVLARDHLRRRPAVGVHRAADRDRARSSARS